MAASSSTPEENEGEQLQFSRLCALCWSRETKKNLLVVKTITDSGNVLFPHLVGELSWFHYDCHRVPHLKDRHDRESRAETALDAARFLRQLLRQRGGEDKAAFDEAFQPLLELVCRNFEDFRTDLGVYGCLLHETQGDTAFFDFEKAIRLLHQGKLRGAHVDELSMTAENPIPCKKALMEHLSRLSREEQKQLWKAFSCFTLVRNEEQRKTETEDLRDTATFLQSDYPNISKYEREIENECLYGLRQRLHLGMYEPHRHDYYRLLEMVMKETTSRFEKDRRKAGENRRILETEGMLREMRQEMSSD